MSSVNRILLALVASLVFLTACGEDEATTTASKAAAPQPSATKEVETTSVTETNATDSQEAEEVVAKGPTIKSEHPVLNGIEAAEGVVYYDEIYANWPYVEMENRGEEMSGASTDTASEEPASASAGDKPYQVIDGKISQNAIEGWKTYNGGGCGTCHGKGGIGAVGPALGNSVSKVLTKEEFMDVVINGRPGTMMRPHKTNKRVMDNIENLYIYLLARGDDVLGPGNLIKMPLGK